MAADPPPGGRRSRKWLLLPLIGLAVAGGVLFVRSRALPVTTTPIVRGRAVEAVYATGTVEAENRVRVKAKTAGSIAEVLVKEGASVKKGELIARVDNPSASFDLQRGRADLSAARAQAGKGSPAVAALRGQERSLAADLETARTELDRVAQLVKRGASAEANLDRARTRVTQIEGALEANRAQQRSTRIDVSANAQRQAAAVGSLAARVADTDVRAPLDGVVLVRDVDLGEVVTLNQPLFSVGDTSSLILEVRVDEADVARIHDGTDGPAPSAAAVSLYAFPKQVFRGRVFEIAPDADRAKKSFLAKVRLEAPPPGLRSGMSAEVNVIVGERGGALLAPAAAVAEGAAWVVVEGRAERRDVTTGMRDLLRVEVVGGLAENDEVVVEGFASLRPGARVRATRREAEKLEPLPDAAQAPRTSL